MLDIDTAIKHCLEVAGEQQERADSAELIDILDGLDVEDCKECAADHRQLAEWLTELRELRRLIHLAKDIAGEDDGICEKYIHHVDGGSCVNDGIGVSNCTCCGNISHCDYNSGGADDE